jgi:pimeloyl-ACP methyl ester carboxylesterase
MLALHGAGVDVSTPFWAVAMPKVEGMWAVLPTGKNEWGEDWHGGSMDDAWAARDALPIVLTKIGVEISDQTILAGHSNGGQGAWHLAARYPDRIVGGELPSTAMADGSHCSIWLAQDPGLRSVSAFVSQLYYTL